MKQYEGKKLTYGQETSTSDVSWAFLFAGGGGNVVTWRCGLSLLCGGHESGGIT